MLEVQCRLRCAVWLAHRVPMVQGRLPGGLRDGPSHRRCGGAAAQTLVKEAVVNTPLTCSLVGNILGHEMEVPGAVGRVVVQHLQERCASEMTQLCAMGRAG